MKTRLFNVAVMLSMIVLLIIPTTITQAQDGDDGFGVQIEIVGEITDIDRESDTLTIDDAVTVLLDDMRGRDLAGLTVGDTVTLSGSLDDDGSIVASAISPEARSESSDDDREDDEDENEEDKVTICHAPPGNPANARTIEVEPDELAEHLEHGDTEGPCDENSGNRDSQRGNRGGGDDDDDDDEDDEDKVTICHIPRGNPNNARTLEVERDELAEHLEHGDTEGPCEGDSAGRGNGQNNGRGNNSDCGASSGRCHPVLSGLSTQLNIEYAELEALRERGFGIGEITRGMLLADAAGVSADEIFSLRESDIGWGDILAEYPDVSPSDLSLGNVMGGGNDEE